MKWQTLPPELVYEIFDQCPGDCKILSVTEPRSFPWYLGHICRTWREIFISSPQFWNTLDIDLNFTRPSPGIVEVARISMVRSGDCPISFRMFVNGYARASSAETTMRQQMLEILVENSARWLGVYLNVSAKDMTIIYKAKNRMPLLRSIQLSLQTYFWDNGTIVQSSDTAKLYNDFLMDATKLTRIYFDEYFQFWKLNWSLITVIHFVAVPQPSQLLIYLSQMSCLVELVLIDPCEGDNISMDGIVPINLPHLKFLFSPAVLLPMIDAPTLQNLHIWIDVYRIEDASAPTALYHYFRSTRHLSKLEIISNGWELAVLTIEHMPRVDHLTLWAESIVELVEILEGCPQMGFLTTVTFVLDTNEVESDHLLETVTSWKRQPGESRGIGPFYNLKEMSFVLLSGYHQRFVDRLKLHLEGQGMDYSISEEIDESLIQFDVVKGCWKI